jgi:hypothetical protein
MLDAIKTRKQGHVKITKDYFDDKLKILKVNKTQDKKEEF